jgi:ATP-binding cassette subfamily F protein 3
MSLVTAHNLSKVFEAEEIFSGIAVEVPQRARIALVGPNGAGKTTLLNILVGRDTPETGGVSRARGIRIGYLPQRPELLGEHTVYEESLHAVAPLRAMEAELARLAADLNDPDKHDSAIAAYGDLQETFEAAGGYTYEQRIKTTLRGLGFSIDDFHKPLAQLSGGQKTRALLARLLLEAPDLLALDEPTNHLDIEAVEWLEGFLKDFSGAVIVVSHDRYFMDAVANTVWELDFGSLETYRGNYSAYVAQREERHTRLLKEYEAQQEYIAKEQDYITRFINSQNTRQAKGRRTRLERLKRDDLILKPRTHRDMTMRLNTGVRSGDLVLRTFGVTVGYPDKALFDAPDLVLRRGEVAALIGANGAGKSTFVKTVVGELQPLAGEVRVGASVNVGYFAQAHESLNPENSILDEILSAHNFLIGEARNYLGRFLFEEDDVFRPIKTLSGGERGRVALAKLALSGANFLILDEPTNHLDVASQEALQNILLDFDGTILLVSHDRYLIQALATQIWMLEQGALAAFDGGYDAYIAARETARQREIESRNGGKSEPNGANKPVVSKKKHGMNPFELQKRIEATETRVHELETQLAQITADLERASASSDAKKVHALGDAYTQTEADLMAAMEEWAALVE